MLSWRLGLRALGLLNPVSFVFAQQSVLDAPGQPSRSNAPIGQYEIVGNSVVSGQQMFLGTLDTVFILDKVENNPGQVNGHPAWASRYSLSTNEASAMDVITNTFCAGGSVLGNGTWLNVGGNQAVITGGATAPSQTGSAPYYDPDGGKSLRLLDPCDGDGCDWRLAPSMTTRRWYPSCELLDDGRVIIVGGDEWGGFVNDGAQTNPTYEFFPPATGAKPVTSPLLQRTLPANLYPLLWVLPSGKLFMQANYGTAILDWKAQKEYQLPDMPHAVRTYPASAGTTMLPLTPQNNWTATIVFCGGMGVAATQWDPNRNWPELPTSQSCVRISPDVSQNYEEDDDVPQGRSMGNMIILPTGKIMYLNGAQTGVAGYGNGSNTVGDSYADNAALQPMLYDPDATSGKRWSRDGLSPSTVARMYHSSATLLADGSILVSGSNPHPDAVVSNTKFPTEYRVEILYPSYYNSRRPEPRGIPSHIGYGGVFFNITLSADDLSNNATNVQTAYAACIRPGFSTHGMNMNQRMIVLESSHTVNADGSGTLHVSPMPPNAAVFPPGPCLFFVVVDGVPSVGVQVMVGSGQIEIQAVRDPVPLPSSEDLSASDVAASTTASAPGASGTNSHAHTANSATRLLDECGMWLGVFVSVVLVAASFL